MSSERVPSRTEADRMEPNYGSTAAGPSMYASQQYGMSSPPLSNGEYATTTTVRSTRIVDVNPYFDATYLKTVRGILKVIELVCTFIAFVISVSAPSSRRTYRYIVVPGSDVPFRQAFYYPYAYGSSVWTDIVTSIAFLITLTLLIFYLFHLVEKYNKTPWHLMELLFCLAAGFCLLIAGAVMIPAYDDPARGAVVFFCWAAMLTYFVEAFLTFRSWRADEPAQGI